MPSSVLDSHAVLVFLFKEPGYEKVAMALEKASESESPLFIAAPNWAEVRYQVERKAGTSKWNETRAKLLGLPIEIVSVDMELAEIAGEIKTKKRMSLADCFAAALAKQRKLGVYTGDPEFQEVEKEVRVIWI